MVDGCSLFQQMKLILARKGFGILDSVLAIRNNSGIAYYSEMPYPSGITSALDKLYAVFLYTGERQRVMYSINIISGVEINFFDYLPIG